jgi:predicted secreted protein
MSWTLGVAIYFIVWWIVLFAVLPIGLRTQDEEGEVVPGTPASAPAQFRVWRIIALNTVVATVVFALIWWVLTSNWVSLDSLPPMR